MNKCCVLCKCQCMTCQDPKEKQRCRDASCLCHIKQAVDSLDKNYGRAIKKLGEGTKDSSWEEEFVNRFFIYNLKGNGQDDHVGAEKDAIEFIRSLLTSERRKMLEAYNDFLLKHRYTDADIYAEEPTAIDRFLLTLNKS